MSHDRARLEAALRQLQAELHSLEGIDPQVRQRLQQTLDDIEAELGEGVEETSSADSAARVDPNAPLAERLAETARHFEQTHPNLAGMVGSVIDALARMGI